jgi:hypothetical protein
VQNNDLDDDNCYHHRGVDESSCELRDDEEEAMRQLLKNLDDARIKAMSAYTSLVSKKNAALALSAFTNSNINANSGNTSFLEESSVASASGAPPSIKLAPPTVSSSSPKSQKRSSKSWRNEHETSSLDVLLSDFEQSFDAMTRSTSDLLTQSASGSTSGLYKSTTLSKWTHSSVSGTEHRSVSVLPTVSESFENMMSPPKSSDGGDESNRLSHISGIDELVSPNTSQIFPDNNNNNFLSASQQSQFSASSHVGDSSVNIEAILEKYSDRLASMVSAKVMMSVSASGSAPAGPGLASSQQQDK